MSTRLMAAAAALLLATAAAADTAVQNTSQQPASVTPAKPALPPAAKPTANTPPAATSNAGSAPALTAQDAQSFFDSVTPYAMQRGDIAGGVIVVVKDGQILVAKGYGYADFAKRKPVIAGQTLFRPGSVSKTFTWTAVMQLVGEGKLDLDRDVNTYLDFRIPDKFGKPITLRELLTHTAGFQEVISDSFLKDPKQLYPIGEYLKRHVPARIFPPGEIVAYSNYGATLAGYIVQRVSGEEFNRYVADHIFKPLGMDHSTFDQPLPAALAPGMSVGYKSASDKQTVPFETVEVAPAGSLSATGTDMAHFMLAQLDGGQYNGASILSPAMVKLMHSPASCMAPGLNCYDLGFYQENRNGLRIIGHAGDTVAFHSDLHLLLDKHVGMFMSFNSAGKEGEVEKLRTELFREFLDRYYPYTAPAEKTVADPKADAAYVAGWYLASRRLETSFRLLYALTQTPVVADPDGTIKIDALKDLSGTPRTWREVAPMTWREVGGQTHTKLVTDGDGNIRYWISDDFLPVEVFQPMHGLRTLGMLKLLGGLFAAVLVLTLLIWIGGAIVRRRFHKSLVLTRNQFAWRLASRVGAVAYLAMLLAWFWLFAVVFADNDTQLDGKLTFLYVLGVIASLGAIAIMIEAILRIARGPGGWLVRVSEFVLGLAGLYGLWAIIVYGLANFSYVY